MKKETILYIIIAALLLLLLITYDNLRQLKNEDSEPVMNDQGFPTELYVAKLEITDKDRITIECRSRSNGDIDYIVYVTDQTTYNFDIGDLSKGAKVVVYADAVMESYPNQMYANSIKLLN